MMRTVEHRHVPRKFILGEKKFSKNVRPYLLAKIFDDVHRFRTDVIRHSWNFDVNLMGSADLRSQRSDAPFINNKKILTN